MASTQTVPKLILPTTPSTDGQYWITRRIVMIGAPGIGKSGLFANGGAKTLFIDTEGNLAHLKVNSLPCRSVEEIREIAGALLEAKDTGVFPYDTIVIDTVDKLCEAIEDEVVAEAKKDVRYKTIVGQLHAVSDIPNGAGYAELGKKLMSILDVFDALPAALVVITHPKSVKVKDPSGADYDKETVALFPSVANRLLGWSQHNLHVQSKWAGTVFVRQVRTVPERGTEGKSHGGLIPDRWEWKTKDLAAEYTELRSFFK